VKLPRPIGADRKPVTTTMASGTTMTARVTTQATIASANRTLVTKFPIIAAPPYCKSTYVTLLIPATTP
jgi:hypothetical protein